MNALETGRIVKRVISEVAGTIDTNGIWELSHVERGGVSEFGYVKVCLMSTAYNAVRALPGFNHSYNEFCNAIDAQVSRSETPAAPDAVFARRLEEILK